METQPPVKNKGGRPPGAMNRLAREAREHAQATGILPHEFLLSVARGDIIDQKYVDQETGEIKTKFLMPELDMRVDAAKAAAPYFAPKMSAVEVISGMSDEQLDAIISGAAAETATSLGADGEAEEAPPHPRARRRIE